MSEVRFGPGGVPDWLEPMIRFCSRCGGQLAFGPVADEERDRLACPNCGFVSYVNPRLVVTTLPITDLGEVMLIRRGIQPGQGLWAQPGGFLEIDETVRDAAIRETLAAIRQLGPCPIHRRSYAPIKALDFEATPLP